VSAVARMFLLEGKAVSGSDRSESEVTRQLLADFGSSFDDADQVLLAPIYAAREESDGVTSSGQLAEAIGSKATSYSDLPAITAVLKNTAQPKDLIITIGAGNICEVAEVLLS